MKNFYLGFDIGGTKSTAILGVAGAADGADLKPHAHRLWPTGGLSPLQCIEKFAQSSEAMLAEAGAAIDDVRGIGIACGGPLDSQAGIIQSPPNLPGWDDIHVVETLRGFFPRCRHIQLENDANADAVAEWRWGAGRGTRNMVFITFGTGCGAGLILDGRLYGGTNGNAGECGHMRLTPFGPPGYGKAGSMEGYCSGGGIAKLGLLRIQERLQSGGVVPWYDPERPPTARDIAVAADSGDELARAIYAECGTRLGEGLALMVDLLNPEAIVIGSIFERSEKLLRPAMAAALRREALPQAERVCRVLPAALGDQLGFYASLALAVGGE